VLGELGRHILKIIDLCVVFCYNAYWQTNKNASWFVVVRNKSLGIKITGGINQRTWSLFNTRV
jgi:hypothetical protein